MMVEPPGQAAARGVLEINDGVLVAVEKAFFKELPGPVRQPAVVERRLGVDGGAVETCKEGGRTGPVETLVVKANADSHALRWTDTPLQIGTRTCLPQVGSRPSGERVELRHGASFVKRKAALKYAQGRRSAGTPADFRSRFGRRVPTPYGTRLLVRLLFRELSNERELELLTAVSLHHNNHPQGNDTQKHQKADQRANIGN